MELRVVVAALLDAVNMVSLVLAIPEIGENMDLIKILKNRLFSIVLICFLLVFSLVIIIISAFNRKSAIKFFQSDVMLGFVLLFLLSLVFCSIYRLKAPVMTLSRMGSILFHFSMILIVIGGVYNHFFKMSGSLVITEGQALSCGNENLKKRMLGRFAFKEFKKYVLQLNKLSLKYQTGILKKLSANIVFTDTEKKFKKNTTILVNHPFFYEGNKFLMSGYGFAPLFVLKEKGKVKNKAFVNLDLIKQGGIMPDKFYFDNWLIRVLFYPDFYSDGKNDKTLSMEVKNPVFLLKITDTDSNKQIYSGKLRMNESAKIGDFTISIEDMRYWMQLYIASEEGMRLVFLGFWLSILGLILRFLKKRRIN